MFLTPICQQKKIIEPKLMKISTQKTPLPATSPKLHIPKTETQPFPEKKETHGNPRRKKPHFPPASKICIKIKAWVEAAQMLRLSSIKILERVIPIPSMYGWFLWYM